jgi:hypothetical protein
MLLSTNRLDRYLASKGHGVFDPDVDPDDSKIVFSEAESVESPFALAGQSEGASPLVAEFDFSALNRLISDESRFILYSGRRNHYPSNLGRLAHKTLTDQIMAASATALKNLIEALSEARLQAGKMKKGSSDSAHVSSKRP